MTNELLLEIGFDNFPAELIGLVKRVLDENFSTLLYSNHIHFDKLYVESTKKRIVLIVQGLDTTDESSVTDIHGFFKENIPIIISNITIPIYHEIDSGKCQFINYISWIQCILFDHLIHFDQENVIYGKGNKQEEYVQIDSVKGFKESLANNSIILEIEERRSVLLNISKKLVREHGYKLYKPKKLVDRFSNLYDNPVAKLLKFDESCLALQDEIIHSILRNEFGLISVVNDHEHCTNYFISITEKTNPINPDELIYNINKKLTEVHQLLIDELDQPLEVFVEELKEIPYMDYGNYKEKTDRLVMFSKIIAEKLGVGKETILNTEKIAFLAKADLATNLVKEIPILKGTAGMIYARRQNESELIAKGISEHYQPSFSDEELPSTTAAKIVALVDKLDAIITQYLIREQTGSIDPLFIRRNALGAIDIILGAKWTLNVDRVLQDGLYSYFKNSSFIFDYDKVHQSLRNIIKINFRDSLIHKGHKFYIIDGIMEDAEFDLVDIYDRIKSITKVIEEDSNNEFLRFIYKINEFSKIKKEIGRDEITEFLIHTKELFHRKQYYEFFKSINEFRLTNEHSIREVLSQEKDDDDLISTIVQLNQMIQSIYDIDSVFIPD